MYGQMDEADTLIEELCGDKVESTYTKVDPSIIAPSLLLPLSPLPPPLSLSLLSLSLPLSPSPLSLSLSIGPSPKEKWYVHCGDGLLWLWRQWSHKKTAPCCSKSISGRGLIQQTTPTISPIYTPCINNCFGRVVLCCFVFLLCCVALPYLSQHLMDD